MVDTTPKKKTVYGRDIYRTGEYIKYFKPDERRNPFSSIYSQKKQDALSIINKSENSKIILDIGGGMGRLSLALANSNQNKIILTDISTNMLKLAVEQADSPQFIRLVNADAHKLPFHDESFDYIVGLDLLCHLRDPESALNEFHRILSADGTLILDSTNSNPLWTLFYPRYLGKNPLNWLRTMRFRGVLPGWEKIVRHYSKTSFFSLLNEAGFRIIKNIKYGPVICPKWYMAVSRKVT